MESRGLSSENCSPFKEGIMRNRIPFAIVLALMVGSLALTGCGGGDEPTSPGNGGGGGEGILSWAVISPLSSPRWAMAVVVAGGKIYAIGGTDTTGPPGATVGTVEEWDPSTGNWTAKAPMNEPRTWATAQAVSGKIYVIGGRDTLGNLMQTVEEYDPSTNAWTTRASISAPARGGMASGVVSGKIYVVGGSDGTSNLNAVEEYDPGANVWALRAPMTTARNDLCAGVSNSILVAVAGWTTTWSSVTEEYNAGGNAWTTKTPLAQGRDRAGAVGLGNYVFVVGGVASPGTATADVQRYNQTNGTWAQSTPLSGARYYLGVVTLNSKLYAVGGLDTNNQVVGTVEEGTFQ